MNPFNPHRCASCEHAFSNPLPADSHSSFDPRLDDILICSACGAINIVTITGTRLILAEELAALSSDELADITRARDHITRVKKN